MPLRLDEDPLRLLDDLPVLKPLLEVGDFTVLIEPVEVPFPRDLDAHPQLVPRDGLQHVSEDTGVGTGLHVGLVGIGREDHDRNPVVHEDVLGGIDSAHGRHLDVEDGHVGDELLAQFGGLAAVAGGADHGEPEFLEMVLHPGRDQMLIVGDEDGAGSLRRGLS